MRQHYIQCGMRPNPSAKTIHAPLPNAIVGLWLREHDPDPQSRVCARRVPVFARDKREAFAGRSSTKTSDPIVNQSDQDLLRARATRNFSLYRLLVPATELPNGQPILAWSCWTPAAFRQNAKNKTPAPWAIRSPGRFLRRRPAAKRPIGGLMAGSLTLLRCGGGRSPVQINGPNDVAFRGFVRWPCRSTHRAARNSRI